MKKVQQKELEEFINVSRNKLDYILELSILQEPVLCAEPVYKFERAFIDTTDDDGKREGEYFCLIYSEADNPEAIFISYNSNSDKFKKIISSYNACKIIFHGENGNGELCESFYCDLSANIANINITFRLLTAGDKKLAQSSSKDDYLNIIFKDFIEDKIWRDCGIIGAFDAYNNFTGYLAFYELAENIRDVSYIYIKREFRRLGYAKKLLSYYINMNVRDNKISYYSYAADKASANLAESCGFLPCAKRYELDI